MAAKKPAQKTHAWEITLLRARGRLLGHVEAPDEETAIKVAIEQFQRGGSLNSIWSRGAAVFRLA